MKEKTLAMTEKPRLRVMVAILATAQMMGCLDGTGQDLVVPLADKQTFETDVMPILAQRCANPGCHGEPDRPLEVYAVLRHRLDPADRWRDVPLSEMELSRNYAHACGFLAGIDTSEDCLLLRKTLPESAGGAYHAGGVIFEDTSEPDYQTLQRWVSSRLAVAP